MTDQYHSLMKRISSLISDDTSDGVAEQLVNLRCEAAAQIVLRPGSDRPSHFESPCSRHPFDGTLPEVSAADLRSDVLHDALHGSAALIVRGFFNQSSVANLLAQLRADQTALSQGDDAGIPEIGCSAKAVNLFASIYGQSGFTRILSEYFDEPPLMIAERTKLRHRQRDKDRFSAIPWHQDVNFFGYRSRGVGVWSALSTIDDSVYGLSVVPARQDDRIGWSGTGDAPFDYGRTVGAQAVEKVLEEYGSVSPTLNPGDAILFDEMTLHSTAVRPWTAEEQLVAISWFFPASHFPPKGTPIAV